MFHRSKLLWLRRTLLAIALTTLAAGIGAAPKRHFAIQTIASDVTATAGPLLQNWDFETGPENTVGTVTGWVVNGNVGDVNFEGATSGNHAAALSAGADSQGDMLSQNFSTSA